MMQNYIDILRQLNYELVKELGLFKHRAGLSFSQRHILYHIKNNISLSGISRFSSCRTFYDE